MISGIDLKATIDYELKRDKKNPTVWKLGVMPSYVFAKITSEAKDNEIETAFKIIQMTLKGWDNFDVEFKTEKETILGRELEVVPISILEKLPFEVITELSEKAIEINQISAVERKN